MPLFSCVRVKRIPNIHGLPGLHAATRHANRRDDIARVRVRPDADSTKNLHYLPWATRADVIDYFEDFKRLKTAVKASERGGTAPIAHLICVVSPAWIKETGDLHDPENPRNKQLLNGAVEWAQVTFGENSILAARLDVDEKGGGVADVFIAPVAKSKKGRAYLSSAKVFGEIQKRHKARNTYAGLQDDWSQHVKRYLDPRIERGKLKAGQGPDWLTPEIYGARKDLAKDRDELQKMQAELDAKAQMVETRSQELDAREKRLEREALSLAEEERRLSRRTHELAGQQSKLSIQSADVNQRAHALKEAKLQTRARSVEVSRRATEVAAAESAQQARAAEVQAREMAVSAREVAVTQEAARLAESQAELAAAEKRLAERQVVIDRGAERQGQLQAALENWERKVERRDAEVSERERAIGAEQARADAVRADAEKQMDEVRKGAARIRVQQDILARQTSEMARREKEVGERENDVDKRKKSAEALATEIERRARQLDAVNLAMRRDRDELVQKAKALDARAEIALSEAREQGLQAAVKGQAQAIEQARLAAVEDGKEDGRRLAASVRPIPLEKVMPVLGGRKDPQDSFQWVLPSLGAVRIDERKQHIFTARDGKVRGYGAIDLVKAEMGADFEAAVRFLATEFATSDVRAAVRHGSAERAAEEFKAVQTTGARITVEDRAPAAPEHLDVIRSQFRKQEIDQDIVVSHCLGCFGGDAPGRENLLSMVTKVGDGRNGWLCIDRCRIRQRPHSKGCYRSLRFPNEKRLGPWRNGDHSVLGVIGADGRHGCRHRMSSTGYS